MYWGYGFSWGGMFLMLLGTALWIALLVVVVWAIVRWISRSTTRVPPPTMPASGPTALEILRQRYARGEIDEATYERMRARLQEEYGPQQYQQPPLSH